MKTELNKKKWIKPEVRSLSIKKTFAGELLAVHEGSYGTTGSHS